MRRNIPGSLLIILLFLLTGKTTVAQWTQMNPANAPHRARETTFVIGDTAYLGNGDDAFFSYANTFSGYTTTGNTWNPEPAFPGGGGDNGYSFVIGDTAYVGGGASPGYNSALYAYSPKTGWIAKKGVAGNVARAFTSGFSIGNKGYTGLGEIPYQTVTGDFYSYDPVRDTFTATAAFPGGARESIVSFAINGYGYVGLGTTRSAPTFNDMYRYNPVIDKWDTMAPLPATAGMEQPAYFVLCGKLIVTLGDTLHSGTNISAQTWMFDPADGPKGSWARLNDFPGTLAYAAQGFTIQDTGYVFGGDLNNVDLTQMWKYIPTLIPPTSVSICAGTGATLVVNGSSAYKWSPSATLSDSITNSPSTPGGVSQTIASPLVTTTYTITEAVCGQTATVVVTVNSGGQSDSAKAIPSSICSGQTSSLTVTGSGNFTWSPSAGLNNDTTGNSVIANPSITTTYTVSSGSGSCSFTDTVVVTVGNTAVGGTVSAVRDTICEGTPGNLTLAGNSSGTIQWQSSTDDISFTDVGDTLASYKTAPLQQTTWYRATVGSGSCSAVSEDTLELYVPPALTASFYYTQGAPNRLSFNSDSSLGNIRSYHWDFGDGNTSTEQNPSHTYAKDTTYYVCLTLYDGSNCSYTFCRYSSLTDGVPTISAAGNWIVYPNPFSEQLTVSSKQSNSHILSIEMYDVLGQLVINRNAGNTTSTSLQLDVSSLAKGMYYVMIRTADADYVQKVVKQ